MRKTLKRTKSKKQQGRMRDLKPVQEVKGSGKSEHAETAVTEDAKELKTLREEVTQIKSDIAHLLEALQTLETWVPMSRTEIPHTAWAASSFPSCPARPKSSSRIESKRPSAAASWEIARFTSPVSDAARFAGRHRPYLVCSTKFSRASKMHNRMLNSLVLFSLVYRLQLWSIRGTIHLENDDS